MITKIRFYKDFKRVSKAIKRAISNFGLGGPTQHTSFIGFIAYKDERL